jgi:hypothetical protein
MPGYWGASRRVAREVRTAARLASPGWQVPIRGTPDGIGSSGGIHRNQCTRTYAGDHQPVDGCRQRTPHSCIRSLQHTRHGGIVRHRHRPQRRTPLAVFGQSTYGCSNHPGLIAPLTQNSGKLGGHPVLRACAAVGRQYSLADVQRDAGNACFCGITAGRSSEIRNPPVSHGSVPTRSSSARRLGSRGSAYWHGACTATVIGMSPRPAIGRPERWGDGAYHVRASLASG